MAENVKLKHPWLIAVWPGMGHVALNAGVYLLAQLDMHVLGELDTGELFDVEHVGPRPRERIAVMAQQRLAVGCFLGLELEDPCEFVEVVAVDEMGVDVDFHG